jgi:hypothetical protein
MKKYIAPQVEFYFFESEDHILTVSGAGTDNASIGKGGSYGGGQILSNKKQGGSSIWGEDE